MDIESNKFNAFVNCLNKNSDYKDLKKGHIDMELLNFLIIHAKEIDTGRLT